LRLNRHKRLKRNKNKKLLQKRLKRNRIR
jgi:hypothetical protein